MQDRLSELLKAVGLTDRPTAQIVGGDPVLPSRFRAGEAAATALAAVAVAANDLWVAGGGRSQEISVDVNGAAASLVSFLLMRSDGDTLAAFNRNPSVTGLYRCGDDRWVHLHGGFPALAEGTLGLLNCTSDPESVARAVKQWSAQDLEDALAQAGMCGAMARSRDEWLAHDQGRALASVPPVEIEKIGDSDPEPLARLERPAQGVRVLDLTRVLAGPTCARTLASHGAEVLKINSPMLPSIPPFVADTGHGKRSAFLDLTKKEDTAKLRTLVRDADIFSDGYRQGALERRGFGPRQLAEIRPGIICVSINAYGHVGPWSGRPGWEQLAQTATGIATDEGTMAQPRLIGAAATDYTTGYLAALGAMVALGRRAEEGGSYHVRASLCQTANWLYSFGLFGRASSADSDLAAAQADAVAIALPYMTKSETGFGTLHHLGPIVRMSETPPRWEQPTVPLGTHEPDWR